MDNSNEVFGHRSLRIIQITFLFICCVLCCVQSLQFLWGSNDYVSVRVNTLVGTIGLFTILFCAFYRKLFLKIDFLFTALFFVVAWISAIISTGFTPYFFISTFFFRSMVLGAIYYLLQVVPTPQIVIRVVANLLIVINSAICLRTITYATLSIFSIVPTDNMFLGCFMGDRLSGQGNPNSLALVCVSLIIMGIYLLLSSKSRMKLFYILPIGLGWFALGMSGSRTSQISVVAVLCFFSFAAFFSGKHMCFCKKRIAELLLIAGIILAIGIALYFSLRLPILIYKGIMMAVARISKNKALLLYLSDLSPRQLITDTSVSGRIPIWRQVIEKSFSEFSRAVLGTSTMVIEPIEVPKGDGVALFYQAHNIVLEWIRLFGLLGTIVWLVPLAFWFINGIKALFAFNESNNNRFLAASFFGMLLAGAAEAEPFYPGCILCVPFFLICGLCVRLNRDRETPKADGLPCETLSETPEKSVE